MTEGSLIRRLPLELLAEVFERTISTDHSRWITSTRETPWILGHVSSTWRRLALSLPSLWSSISIDGYHKHTVQMLRVLLTRSGTAPLTLRLYLSFMKVDQMKELYLILCGERRRWKSISITLESYYGGAAAPFVTLLKAPADYPILESFDLVMDVPFGVVYLPAGSFDRAPMLHTVRMRPLLTIDLPWSRITTFSTSAFTVEQQFMILRESPQLQTLEIESYRGTHMPPAADSYPLLHPSLATLEVPNISSFPFLTLPALTDLYVNNIVDTNDADNFSVFVRQSGCRLESLRFPFAAFSASLVDTFAMQPNLRELHTVFFDGNVLPLLFALSSAPLILPKLEELDLNQAYGVLNLPTVVTFATYRHENTPLRYLKMEGKTILPKRPQAQSPYLASLRELRRNGLVIEIEEGGKDIMDDPF
ncbi:hypothetical protein IW261DRAFT_1418266 [Armillaria novae-zelandiae]|uniref:F-box domain-containing protein n=1 Tax=Armillaria novae-zelandiae TaxID=153914 RepID=A0AA39PEG1_9AGAR|nr:hypothetical protein IW261DRAFT_1418266 [Armillaria novae-zelandiae]